ncbi:MAG: PocR ligand-binding domain-containing protein [Deltaproteobacteria bacterium]|nr:PocR ligand-binding domain-containing protein [Deltaproteobacteria bacterium]
MEETQSIDLTGDLTGDLPPSVLERRISLAELLDINAFREVCASFVDLYKIGIKLFDVDGTKLVDIRVGNGDWCGYIFQNSVGRQRCTTLVTRIKQFEYPGLADGEVVEQRCFSGLKYILMPINYGGDQLGRVVYGPFLPADVEAPGEEVFAFPDGFEPTRLWAYGDKIRRAPDEMIMKILTNFRGVVDTITFIAMKALMTQQLHLESITASYNDLSASNQKLRESLERLTELDRLKSNFLAMISHELRTPLTSVIGYSEMLLEGMAGDITDEQRDYVGTIKDKGESLLDLIGSLLDMSKIEAGAMNLNLSDIQARPLLEAAQSYVVPQASKKSITLEIETAPDLPTLRADRDKLRQCVINLLGNAVKFTPQAGRITVAADVFVGPRRYSGEEGRFGTPDERFMRIQVRDSGIGIPADKLEKVFSSFYQVDNSVTREYGGTGLGLAIVKRFVEAHRGEVWVESQEGRGTTFSLLFPLELQAALPLTV